MSSRILAVTANPIDLTKATEFPGFSAGWGRAPPVR